MSLLEQLAARYPLEPATYCVTFNAPLQTHKLTILANLKGVEPFALAEELVNQALDTEWEREAYRFTSASEMESKLLGTTV